MREIQTSIEIKASAARVWAVLTDLRSFPAWNPFIAEAEGEIREGARLKIRITPPGGKGMTFKPKVTRVVPERKFSWLGRFLFPGLFDGAHIFEIVDSGDGGVRFIHREQFSGLLVPLLWRSLDGGTRRGFEAMNAALKQRVEGEHASQRPMVRHPGKG